MYLLDSILSLQLDISMRLFTPQISYSSSLLVFTILIGILLTLQEAPVQYAPQAFIPANIRASTANSDNYGDLSFTEASPSTLSKTWQFCLGCTLSLEHMLVQRRSAKEAAARFLCSYKDGTPVLRDRKSVV